MAEAAEARQRAEEDLAMWEAFKTSLEAKQDEIAEPDPKELERLARERTAREQIKQEYEKFLSRPDFDPNDDQSTWENFTNSL
jgi:hypothetical protein